ncbi:hypothetical protein ACJX0J_042409, partial [Zea mays]
RPQSSGTQMTLVIYYRRKGRGVVDVEEKKGVFPTTFNHGSESMILYKCSLLGYPCIPSLSIFNITDYLIFKTTFHVILGRARIEFTCSSVLDVARFLHAQTDHHQWFTKNSSRRKMQVILSASTFPFAISLLSRDICSMLSLELMLSDPKEYARIIAMRSPLKTCPTEYKMNAQAAPQKRKHQKQDENVIVNQNGVSVGGDHEEEYFGVLWAIGTMIGATKSNFGRFEVAVLNTSIVPTQIDDEEAGANDHKKMIYWMLSKMTTTISKFRKIFHIMAAQRMVKTLILKVTLLRIHHEHRQFT